MQTQQQTFEAHKMNANGTPVRIVTEYAPERVTELSYQKVSGRWVSYKRVVHAVH